MCTAATYQTRGFYMGRTLDYEFSYGDEITITPRRYPFHFRHMGDVISHYAMIGTAHVAGDYPLYYDAMNEGSVHGRTEFCRQCSFSGIVRAPVIM